MFAVNLFFAIIWIGLVIPKKSILCGSTGLKLSKPKFAGYRKTRYILRVKDNQAKLRQDIEDWFVHGDQQNFHNMTMNYHETISKTSGRVEIRRCWAISDKLAMEHIRHMRVGQAYKPLFVFSVRRAQLRKQRTLALNLLKQDKTKSSLKQKRFRAAMDISFLWQLLSQV